MSLKSKTWKKSAFSQINLVSSGSDEPLAKKTKSFFTQENSEINPNRTLIESSLKNSSIDINSSDWIENFAPSKLDDLAVHSKKISEIQDWIKHCEAIKSKYPGQMLLITGPAGSGKTATIRTLAKEAGYQLVEWVTPLDVELTNSLGDDQKHTYKESQIETFKRFLFRSSRYKSLFEPMEKRLILVEDFPNVFLKDSSGFTEILSNYTNYGKSPLIFIVTDSKSRQLNLSYNLFPDNLKEQLLITHISFNPVSTTLMTKALKRISNLMSKENLKNFYKIPGQDIVDSISLASQGDIRNAVINLHFASLKGASRLHTESQKTSKNSKSRRKAQQKLTTIGKDETITMMHALGRVFYPKYVDKSVPKTLLHSPEEITDAFSPQPKNFVDFVHTNYLAHFANIENVLGAIDSLSISDVLMSEYREDSIGLAGLNIAIRGVMVNNDNPVTGWMPIRGPKKINQENRLDSGVSKLGLDERIPKNLLSTDYKTFVNIIKS